MNSDNANGRDSAELALALRFLSLGWVAFDKLKFLSPKFAQPYGNRIGLAALYEKFVWKPRCSKNL